MKNIQPSKNNFYKHATIMLFALLLSLTGNGYARTLKNTPAASDQQVDKKDQPTVEDSVYSFVEKMPEFPGGEKGVVRFLNQTMRYPEEAVKKDEHGKVIVQFVISKTGKVGKAKILKSVSPELDAEALRVIGLLPDWTPGEQQGEKVAVYRIIPILFQKATSEDAWEVNEKTVVVIDNVKMPDSFSPIILNFDKFATMNVLKPFPDKERSKLVSKYGKQAENGVILLTTNKIGIQYSVSDSTVLSLKKEDIACKENAILPVFPGGETKLLNYIADSIQYPFVSKRLNTEGKVLVRFTVDTTGKVSDATIVRSVDYFLDKEALRVIKTMTDWIPGSLCGKNLNFLVTVPVTFKLDLPKTGKKEWVANNKTIILLNGERLPSTFKLEWLQYTNLASYKTLEPKTKEVTKELTHKYGRDAVNGVILIETRK